MCEYIASTKGKLTAHVLPGDAPDLNPDEQVGSQAKRAGVASCPLRRGRKLPIRVEQQLRNMQKNRRPVRSLCQMPSVSDESGCAARQVLVERPLGGGQLRCVRD